MNVPAGASGSSTMRAHAAVRAGAPVHESDGERFAPSHVYALGMVSPVAKAELVITRTPDVGTTVSVCAVMGGDASFREESDREQAIRPRRAMTMFAVRCTGSPGSATRCCMKRAGT